VATRSDELLLENKRLGLLVSAVRREKDILALDIRDSDRNSLIINNPQLMDIFRKNRKLITSIAILQEFLKETAGALLAKELVADMASAYSAASNEDAELEAAMAASERLI